jgi:REP element-mobilizing transposase RayT
MGRGIDRTKIFNNKADREDFLRRLADLCEESSLIVYGWALMPNHFHLLARTGLQALSKSMRKLLTGYVVNFNRRHQRHGHLFQNRYQSIICEEEPYLLELTRYIHLNPLRVGMVEDMERLQRYAWTGHSAIMGSVRRHWQDTDTVLAYFGKRRKEAMAQYEAFVRGGIEQGKRPELVGGGLLRSSGGWSQVLSLRRKGIRVASDDRILGSSAFVETLLDEVDEREKETLRLRRRISDLASLAEEVAEQTEVSVGELRSGSRSRRASRARKWFCQLAVKRMGYPGAEVARFLGVTSSAVNRAAHAEEIPELHRYP